MTSDRVLRGKPVDRSSLIVAYESLGLPWDESCCATAAQDPKAAPDVVESSTTRAPIETVEPSTPIQAPPLPKQRRAGYFANHQPAFVTALGLLLLIFLGSQLPRGGSHTSTKPLQVQNWADQFSVDISDGFDSFQNGDYEHAKAIADSTLKLARRHEATSELASAMRIKGDLAAEAGSYAEAKASYQAALTLWEVLRKNECKPAVLEALGDLETRFGNYPEAKADIVASLNEYSQLDDRVGVAMAKRDMGSLQAKLGDVSEAGHWFAESHRLLMGLSKPDLEIDLRGREALLSLRTDDPKKASAEFQACLQYWTEKRHRRWIAVTQYRLGLASLREGHPQVAENWVKASEQNFGSSSDMAGVRSAQRLEKTLQTQKTPVSQLLSSLSSFEL